MKTISYSITARWGSRRETARACAERLARMLTGLAEASPIFARWNQQGESPETAMEPFCTMPPDIDELTKIIEEAAAVYDATGEPWPEQGFSFSAWNGMDDPHGAVLMPFIGHFDSNLRFPNWVELQPPSLSPETKDLYTLDRMIDLVMTLADAWTPDWVQVEPDFLNLRVFDFPKDIHPVRAGWITYLKPAFAAAIVPPPTVLARATPEGGLLLITGTDPLDPENAAEIALFKEVQHALEPLYLDV